MIYVTGDTHGYIDIEKFSYRNSPFLKGLTKDDYVIICGDFGLVWDNDKSEMHWRKWLEEKSFTTLFVDGNHENHNMLDAYPIETWNGGNIHHISDSIIHLMRGQVYEIDGYTYFTMGGAESHDKEYRVEDVSWWSREMPSKEEMEQAINNLRKHDFKVDYVITHGAPSSVQREIEEKYSLPYPPNYFTDWLDDLVGKHGLQYKKWYCGHYHFGHTSEVCKGLEILYGAIHELG